MINNLYPPLNVCQVLNGIPPFRMVPKWNVGNIQTCVFYGVGGCHGHLPTPYNLWLYAYNFGKYVKPYNLWLYAYNFWQYVLQMRMILKWEWLSNENDYQMRMIVKWEWFSNENDYQMRMIIKWEWFSSF